MLFDTLENDLKRISYYGNVVPRFRIHLIEHQLLNRSDGIFGCTASKEVHIQDNSLLKVCAPAL